MSRRPRGPKDAGSRPDRRRLEQGDAILFEADVPHVYANVGDGECDVFLVMTYADAQS